MTEFEKFFFAAVTEEESSELFWTPTLWRLCNHRKTTFSKIALVGELFSAIVHSMVVAKLF